MIKEVGAQIFTVRDYLNNAEEIRNTFSRLKSIGYSSIQTAGVPKISYEEFGRIAKECGLKIIGTHDDFDLMLNDPEKSMENHRLLGTDIMGRGGRGFLDGPDKAVGYHTEEQLTETIEKLNRVTYSIAPRGFKFSYHNHGHEFAKFNGKWVIDTILEQTDSKVFTLCLDLYWVQFGGADVRHFIRTHGDRISILHLKDMIRGRSGPCMAEIGQGSLYWEGIFEEAQAAGIENYIVEQDDCYGKDPFECLKVSFDYISRNFMG